SLRHGVQQARQRTPAPEPCDARLFFLYLFLYLYLLLYLARYPAVSVTLRTRYCLRYRLVPVFFWPENAPPAPRCCRISSGVCPTPEAAKFPGRSGPLRLSEV